MFSYQMIRSESGKNGLSVNSMNFEPFDVKFWIKFERGWQYKVINKFHSVTFRESYCINHMLCLFSKISIFFDENWMCASRRHLIGENFLWVYMVNQTSMIFVCCRTKSTFEFSTWSCTTGFDGEIVLGHQLFNLINQIHFRKLYLMEIFFLFRFLMNHVLI